MISDDADGLPPDVLAALERISSAAEQADGAAPLDEATWLAVRHRPAVEVGWWLGDEGFALLVDDGLSLVVHPDARREGRGTALLLEVADVTEGERLTAWSHGDHPGAAVLAQRFGFDRARELWVMRRPSTDPLPPLAVPDDVELRGYEDADEADLLATNAAAFADHPEQGALDAAGLGVRRREPWWDPAGLIVARDRSDGRMLGFHWTKRHSPTAGEVYVLGVAPGAQGRGLGRLLSLAGLHHLVDGGADEVHLYVEADNAPAVRLYTGLGFTHAARDTHVQYVRPAGGGFTA